MHSSNRYKSLLAKVGFIVYYREVLRRKLRYTELERRNHVLVCGFFYATIYK